MSGQQAPTIPYPRSATEPPRRASMPAVARIQPVPPPSHRPIHIPNQKRSQSSGASQNADSRLHYFLSMLESGSGASNCHNSKQPPLRIEDALDLGDDEPPSPGLTGSSWGSNGWHGPEGALPSTRKAASQPPTPVATPPQSRRASLLSSLTSRPTVGELNMTPASTPNIHTMERTASKGKKHYNPSRDPRLLGIF